MIETKISSGLAWLRAKRYRTVKVAALSLFGCLLLGTGIGTGIHYRKKALDKTHSQTLYQVFDHQQLLGLVSDPSVVRNFIQKRKAQMAAQNPDMKVSLDTGSLQIKPTSTANGKAEDAAVLSKLSGHLSAYATGVALKIDGKVVGYFKDKQSADQLLQQYKDYQDTRIKKQEKNIVHILSADSGPKVISKQVTNKVTSFKQQVDESTMQFQPDQLSNPQDVLEKLKTGGVPLHTYTVKKGDCLSCIASNLKITQDLILQNNPDINKQSILQIGQKLNITQYQPMLSMETHEQIKEVRQIPYPVKYEDDSNLGIGYNKLVKSGVYGKKQVTMDVTKVNGQTVSSKVLDSSVLQQPAAAKYLKGTSPVAGPFSTKSDYDNRAKGNFLSWPLSSNYLITSPFGYRPDPFNGHSAFHDGIDIGAPSGTYVHAAASGTVLKAGWYGGFGNCVIINNGHSIHTLYGHMRTGTLRVKVGEYVKRGEILGRVGMTGRATGPHLHFGVYWHGRAVDPWQLLTSR